MSNRVTLSVDAMGGDFGPHVILPACISALKRYPYLEILLIGEISQLDDVFSKQNCPELLRSRLELVSAGESVSMDEKPSSAIRHRQDSSMCLAVKAVGEKRADACVSAGNTGALMAFGRMVLKMLPGIDRPAIIASVPTMTGHCYILDLGANVDCSAEHLLQFAIMGSVMMEAVEQKRRPTVGLLNVGEEIIKGNEQVRLANDLISQQSGLNYIGYIEGDDVFDGKADIVVCDGFVGNVVLKSSEGLARLITCKVQESFTRNWVRRLMALLSRPVLKEIQVQMDPSRRNGATLLGLQGIVIKSHGGADKKCFGYALDQAIAEVLQNVPVRISERLACYMNAPDERSSE
ncbi:phosphate acyltransferase PlsX [Neptunomonas antarctica]|uniref:Phosphate acyltransferase n=1 Tax=Neptunomonas antarctica TaxID=619304 RepID=A0A1N7PJF9_9GAMM|nr:phosphate acyltransferase PlsX [Neptunomonas antarctica]SIT10765.1 phosphate:acyl-[acyl carrier protein] acyltransferase [Neptunomonas antarctica]